MKCYIKYLCMALAVSLCVSCERNSYSGTAVEPTSFSIKFDTIRATKIDVTIKPQNENACYYVDMFNLASQHDETLPRSDQYYLDYGREMMDMLYKLHLSKDPNADFADIFLYNGKHSLTYDFLLPDADYEFITIQVNPSTRELYKAVTRIPFHTAKIDSSDVKFEIGFQNQNVIITPSNDDTYIVIIDRFEYVYEHSNLPDDFVVKTMRMFEDYEFIKALKKSGRTVINLDEDVSGMIDGDNYVLIVFGYNGEINTKLTVSHFVYHRGGETEILHDY